MEADFSEVFALAARIQDAAASIDPKVRVALRKTAFDIVSTAGTLVPVDTGATKSSIHPQFSGNGHFSEARIGPTTEYSPFLEYGTVRAAAQPFMGPSLTRHAPGLAQALGQLGMEALK